MVIVCTIAGPESSLNPLRFGELGEVVEANVVPGTVDVRGKFVFDSEQMACEKGLLFTYGVGFTITTTLSGSPAGHPKASGVAV